MAGDLLSQATINVIKLLGSFAGFPGSWLAGKQPAAVRWLEVLLLYAIALGARIHLGPLYGGSLSLFFTPCS